MTAAEDRAAKLATLADSLREEDLTGAIVADLADYIGDTAGELGPKAVDEIAYAYLAGAADAVARGDSSDEVKHARQLVRPILAAINRTSDR